MNPYIFCNLNTPSEENKNMIDFAENRRLSYTYLIETNSGLLYIGSRRCDPGVFPDEDVKYWGSSKNKELKETPNSQKKKYILGVFLTREEAYEHEIILHTEYDVAKNPKFANKARQTSKAFCCDKVGKDHQWYGRKHTEGTKQKMSRSSRGRTLTPEHCQKISDAVAGEKHPWYGRKHTEESKQKMSKTKVGMYAGEKNPMYGRKHTLETRQKQSELKKGKYLGEKSPLYGKSSPNRDNTIYTWKHKDTGIVVQMTRYDLVKTYNLTPNLICNVVNKKSKSHKGWTIVR